MDTEKEMSNSTAINQTSQWVLVASDIARRVGCASAVDPLLARALEVRRGLVSVAVVGGRNAGKSCRINALIERKLLPVSGLASDCTFSICASRCEKEDGFNSGSASGPLGGLNAAIEADQRPSKHFQIRVTSHWLAERSIELAEKIALDATDEALDMLVEECLQGADLVVLIIDALSPIRRAEIKFMHSCVARSIPLVATISKIDKVADGEVADLIGYIAKHVESCGVGIPATTTSVTVSGVDGIETLRENIDRQLSTTDFSKVRREELFHILYTSINTIRSAAQVRADAQVRNQAEVEYEIQQRKQQNIASSLEWTKLSHALQERRLARDNDIRTCLEQAKEGVLEELLYDLERSNDVKVWWQRDLPFRLKREIKALADRLSSSANKGIAADIEWLRDQLVRTIKYPFQALASSTLSIDGPKRLDQEQSVLPLSDSHLFRITSRLGTAATVIMAGSLMATAGIAGAALAVSVLAGLAAEQVALYNTRRDRNVVRAELQKVVELSLREFVAEVSHKLKQGYEEIIRNLKLHEELWQQAQLQSLTAYAEKKRLSDDLDYTILMRDIDSLAESVAVISAQT